MAKHGQWSTTQGLIQTRLSNHLSNDFKHLCAISNLYFTFKANFSGKYNFAQSYM